MKANPGADSPAPLTEAVFLILLSLAGDRKHGYAILKDVESLSRGAVQLSTSTLYGALGRLQEQELIVRIDEDEGEHSGPGLPRKFYQLTARGRGMLKAESARLQRLASISQVRLKELGLTEAGG